MDKGYWGQITNLDDFMDPNQQNWESEEEYDNVWIDNQLLNIVDFSYFIIDYD